MKKILLSFILISLFACAQAEEIKEIKEIEELVIVVVPFYDAESIETVMEPVELQLKADLLTLGFNVKSVEFRVTTSYGAAGEALAAGSADVGMISGPTYVDFSEDGLEVILQSLRGICPLIVKIQWIGILVKLQPVMKLILFHLRVDLSMLGQVLEAKKSIRNF